ncbi:MAG: trigger factor, partial [Actinomycetota bacterium]|nr:trigger factor [Actinomycetota bacterium]
MKTDLESLSPTRVKLTVELLFDELQPSFDKAYASIAKQVSVPGFRKGKVPARVIEQRFGRGAVLEEAINDAVPKAYEDALREKEIVPVGRPEVDVTEIEDGEKVTFTAEVDVRPEFELPDYKAITVEVDAAEANDADIDEHIDNLRTRFASLKDVDRACADGDVLLVDIAGSTDSGDDVDDLSGNAMSYEMGTDGMLPGFDDAVRGASAGETR